MKTSALRKAAKRRANGNGNGKSAKAKAISQMKKARKDVKPSPFKTLVNEPTRSERRNKRTYN
jgi:hypothetical protein